MIKIEQEKHDSFPGLIGKYTNMIRVRMCNKNVKINNKSLFW